MACHMAYIPSTLFALNNFEEMVIAGHDLFFFLFLISFLSFSFENHRYKRI